MAWFWPVSRKSTAMTNDKDPWGKKPNDQGPPDLDEVLANFQKKLSGLFGGGGDGDGRKQGGKPQQNGSGGLFFLIIVALVGWAIYDSIHIIKEGDEGVVLRFGEHRDTLPPGMHFRWPRPIEDVSLLNVDKISSVEYGGDTQNVTNTMLTADENMVDVKLEVQYRIKDSAQYLFQVNNVNIILREAIASSIREVVGRHSMEFTITENRQQVADEAKELLQTILDDYQSGIEVSQYLLTDAQVPYDVQASLNDANKARQDRTRFKQQAEAYKLDITPKARAAAAEKVELASANSNSIVENAERDVAPYRALLEQYRLAPEITRERMYLDATEEVYSKATKIIMDTGEGNNGMFYLPLDKIMSAQMGRTSEKDEEAATSADSVIGAARQRVVDERAKDKTAERIQQQRRSRGFTSGGLR